MVVPIPAALLDIGFVTNIMISLAVLMVALNVAKPLDFSSFPTVLLFATLFRLALNVASTRVVLVHGHEGAAAAGHVIEAFGSFLIGGDYAVGIFVFVILMIINLVVITKGAGRVSEVSARFTLDAMPGKQMAIDADLNAGLLTPEEAKARRQEVATEADFYGSMDGASKFVKGDAVAGVLILVVNVIGGLILGTVSHGMSLGDAASNLCRCSRSATRWSRRCRRCCCRSPPPRSSPASPRRSICRARSPASSARPAPGCRSPASSLFLGLLPGHAAFHHPARRRRSPASSPGSCARPPRPGAADATPPRQPPIRRRARSAGTRSRDDAALGLELGFGLVGLVDERKGAPLMARITGIRRQLSRELGFVVPMVRVRDELDARRPTAIGSRVAGVVVAEDEIWPDELLALDSGDLLDRVDGRAVQGSDLRARRGLDRARRSAPRRWSPAIPWSIRPPSSPPISTRSSRPPPPICSAWTRRRSWSTR